MRNIDRARRNVRSGVSFLSASGMFYDVVDHKRRHVPSKFFQKRKLFRCVTGIDSLHQESISSVNGLFYEFEGGEDIIDI